MSPSDRLNQVLKPYKWYPSQYPDIKELTQLLSDVTHDEKVSILKRHLTLYIAAYHGHTEIITIILSSVPQHQRLDVLLVDGYTLLHHAAYCGESDCVETILTHLSPEQQLKILSVRNGDGMTLADSASHIGHKKTERELREYKQRAEQQLNKARNKELQQTKLQLDSQAKDIQTLTSAVSELDTSNKNKDEILHKITEESKVLKSTVQKLNEKISKQTAEAAKCLTENGQQQDQILKQQTDITTLQEMTTNLCETVDATGRQYQQDITNLKLHYETKFNEQQEQITRQHEQTTLQHEQKISEQREQINQQHEQSTQQQEQITRQQEQITRQQTQIDVIMSTVTVRNLAISNLNDRHGYLRDDVDRIDETVDNLTGTVERIDEQFYPESNAVGRGAPHDGGDEVIVRVIEEHLIVPQSATNG